MNRKIILTCFLLITTIQVLGENLSVLLEVVKQCKKIKRSDADILGLILRMETLEYELNTKCTVGCVLMKIDVMSSIYLINKPETKKVIKLFELPLSYAQIDSLVEKCEDVLSSKYYAWVYDRRINILPELLNDDDSESNSNKNSSDKYMLVHDPNVNKPSKNGFHDTKPSQYNSNESQSNHSSYNDSKLSQNKFNPVSFIERKHGQNNYNKSKFSRRNSNENKYSQYNFIQIKPRLYKRNERKEQRNECTESARFFRCFNKYRSDWGYL